MFSKLLSTFAVLAAVFGCGAVFAQSPTASRVTWDLSNLAMDLDYSLFPPIYGLDLTQNGYTSQWNDSGWTTSVTGTYLGETFQMSYSGTYQASTGAASWSASGNCGSDSFSTTGSATYSDGSLTADSAGVLGSSNWNWQGSFTYSADLSSFAGPESYYWNGKTPLESAAYAQTYIKGYWYDTNTPIMNLGSSGQDGVAFSWEPVGSEFDVAVDPNAPGSEPGIVSSSPEPSSICLLGVATLGLLAFAWRKRRR
jgi:hypothetical protein